MKLAEITEFKDKAQNWNGYKEYPTSGNSYILRWSSKNENLILYIDRCSSVLLATINIYLEVLKKMYFLLLLLEMYLCPDR